MQRNRLKRAIREGCRTAAPRLGSYDYNFVVIPRTNQREAFIQFVARLRAELDALFTDAANTRDKPHFKPAS